MKPVYKQIELLIAMYPPDKVTSEHPEFSLVPHHWWLTYGRLTISIACGEYNYCDHYNVISGSSFRYVHPSTCSCEIGVFDHTLRGIRNHGWVNPHTQGDPRNVWAWAQEHELEDVVSTIYNYCGTKTTKEPAA